jgi:hypothetical protein
MPRPRLTSKRSVRIAAAAAGGALVSLPVIGAVSNRLRGEEAAAGLLTSGVDPELLAEAERTGQTASQKQSALSQLGSIDTASASSAWSLDGIAGLVELTTGLGGKIVSAGVDGAGEIAHLAGLAGKGVHGLLEVAGAVGGALPDLGDVADAAGAVGEVAGAVGGAAGDILGAIGDGLGDLNF